MIGCMSHLLLDEERTFPCTRTISEAVRQNFTQRSRTDYTRHVASAQSQFPKRFEWQHFNLIVNGYSQWASRGMFDVITT